MNIIKAIKTAIEKKDKRGYEHLYWCIDLHGVILEPTYDLNNTGAKAYKYAIETLRTISKDNSNKIILWTSSYDKPIADFLEYMKNCKVRIDYVNENPEYTKTNICDFTKKFYFDILLDDKAGFDAETDWLTIYKFLINQWCSNNKTTAKWCERCQIYHIVDGKNIDDIVDEVAEKLAVEIDKEILNHYLNK